MEGVLPSVEAVLTVAQVSAFDPRVETFAVFLEAFRLLAVAAPLVRQLALLSHQLQLVAERIGVPFQDHLASPLPLVLEVRVVTALVARTLFIANQPLRKTLAIHQQAF